jgi:hypothetical protein
LEIYVEVLRLVVGQEAGQEAVEEGWNKML